MIKTKCVSISKGEKSALNEDAVIARKNVIAVSDGAGGGGLFADRWSHYLLKHLPASPIGSAEELDKWIGSIWETYYNRAEESAKRLGGMELDKFYDEGSFATLAAVWYQPTNSICNWIAYGDSVVFHYDYDTKELRHSFTALADFDRPPYLINCKEELNPAGFRSGDFAMTPTSFVFVTSDAFAHYVLMMYELSKSEIYRGELRGASAANSKNGNILKRASALSGINFERDVIEKLRKGVYDESRFAKWVRALCGKGLLAFDDCSAAVMYEVRS
ncbi:MAG: hypothetical protein K2K26_06545 [Muribaculaceae bacterium]|nr:hypothetical protein [Muribaculaceae bacterium]